MALYPGAEKRLLPPGVNYSTGGMGAIRGVVIHVIVGSLNAADSAFKNPKWKASAHFGVGKDGRIVQWVDTKDKAWAEAAGNPNWISVETEGQPTEALTDAQITSCARVVKWVSDTHGGFPLEVTDSPNGSGVGTHQMGGAAWGGHSCPGSLRAGQRGEIVRRAAGATPTPSGEDDLTPDQDSLLRQIFNNSNTIKTAVVQGAQPLYGNLVNEIVTQVIAEIKKLPAGTTSAGATPSVAQIATAVAAELSKRLA